MVLVGARLCGGQTSGENSDLARFDTIAEIVKDCVLSSFLPYVKNDASDEQDGTKFE